MTLQWMTAHLAGNLMSHTPGHINKWNTATSCHRRPIAWHAFNCCFHRAPPACIRATPRQDSSSHKLLGVQCAAGSKGSSVTLQTVIREGESIIHGRGGLMYHGDCQTDTTVSDTQPAASYPLASAQHKARQSEHTTHGCNRGNKRRVRERLGGWREGGWKLARSRREPSGVATRSSDQECCGNVEVRFVFEPANECTI